jgi:hypothetical protein
LIVYPTYAADFLVAISFIITHDLCHILVASINFCMQELVSFRHPHVRNPRLQDDYESKCQMYLESPYDEMVAAHIG